MLARNLPPISLHGISEGVDGVRQTLAMMRAIVREWRHRPEVTEAARGIIADIPEKRADLELEALFQYVRDGIRYTADTNEVERLQTPDYTLRERQGDCDDQSILLAAMLEAVGIPARFVAVGFSPDYFEHVYVEGNVGGEWVALDPTERVPAGWYPPDPLTRINQPI